VCNFTVFARVQFSFSLKSHQVVNPLHTVQNQEGNYLVINNKLCNNTQKYMELLIKIEAGENGWLVGQIEEIPAVMSQGRTAEELKANLIDALDLYLEVQKDNN
jgi:predicted RNase H-like HicB family nuclease